MADGRVNLTKRNNRHIIKYIIQCSELGEATMPIQLKKENKTAQKPLISGTEQASKLPVDVKAFDIDINTNVITKCPAGHAPKNAGISKGQTTARFSHELCENCANCEKCQSKRQTKDYVVRINLKEIETSSEYERAKSAAAAISKITQAKDNKMAQSGGQLERLGVLSKSGKRIMDFLQIGRKDGSGSKLRKYGIAAAAVVVCLVLGITALSGGMMRASNGQAALETSSNAEPTDSPDVQSSSNPGNSASDQTPDSGQADEGGGSNQDSETAIVAASATDGDDSAKPDESEENKSQDPSDATSENDDSSDPDEPGGEEPATSAQNSAGLQGASTSTPAPQPRPASQSSSGDALPYLIYVSKDSFTIAILGRDEEGEFTRLLQTFNTAIGRTSAQTRAGTYTITSKTRWIEWNATQYTPYGTQHSGGLWFHGPIYGAKDPYKLKAVSFNEIGTAATSGCMRTTTSAAAWIYNNCAVGTTVIIANDSKYTSSPWAKIDAEQLFDPTDPDARIEIPEDVPEDVGEDIADDITEDMAEDINPQDSED